GRQVREEDVRERTRRSIAEDEEIVELDKNPSSRRKREQSNRPTILFDSIFIHHLSPSTIERHLLLACRSGVTRPRGFVLNPGAMGTPVAPPPHIRAADPSTTLRVVPLPIVRWGGCAYPPHIVGRGTVRST